MPTLAGGDCGGGDDPKQAPQSECLGLGSRQLPELFRGGRVAERLMGTSFEMKGLSEVGPGPR